MTSVRKSVVFVVSVVALLALVLLAGCGSGGNSASSTSSNADTSADVANVSARVIDAEIYLKSDTSTELANSFVDAIKGVEGVVSAEFKPATEHENARICYSVIQGTSTIAIEDMLMEMDGFADVFIQKTPTDIMSDSGASESASDNAADKSEASDGSAAESSAAAEASAESSEAAQPAGQDASGSAEAASQE